MSMNSFGHLFRVTTWGESHGPAIGCVVDGCPPLIPLTEADIQLVEAQADRVAEPNALERDVALEGAGPGRRRGGEPPDRQLAVGRRGPSGAVLAEEGLTVAEGVEPLVQPGSLGLVVPDQPVPELMASLVHGDGLGGVHARPGQHPRTAREDRGILHPARGARSPGGVHGGDLRVRIGPVPKAVVEERGAGGPPVALGLPLVLGVHHDAHQHVAPREGRRLHAEGSRDLRDLVLVAARPLVPHEGLLEHDVVRVRGPSEAMDPRREPRTLGRHRVRVHLVFRSRRDVPLRVPATVQRLGGHPLARSGDLARVLRGQVERHVVRPVVRVELGVHVEGVRPPAPAPLVHGELGEPVAEEDEVSLRPGPPPDPREARLPLDVHRHLPARRDGLGQVHAEQRPVERCPGVGHPEGDGVREVHVTDLEGPDLLPTEAPVDLRPAEAPLGLGHVEAAVVGVGVQVEVEPEVADLLTGSVSPGQAHGARQLLLNPIIQVIGLGVVHPRPDHVVRLGGSAVSRVLRRRVGRGGGGG